MKILLLLFFIAAAHFISMAANDLRYPVREIPDSLKENANAVIRKLSVSYGMYETGHLNIRKTYAITILNEQGDKFANFEDVYNKFISVEKIEGVIYDKDGNQLSKIKPS